MSEEEPDPDPTVEAIHISTDIAIRLIQGDFGSDNAWRIVQTMGAVIDYIRDLSVSGDADSVDFAAELIGIIIDNMVYLTPLATDEDIDLAVSRAREVLDKLLDPDETPDENGDN